MKAESCTGMSGCEGTHSQSKAGPLLEWNGQLCCITKETLRESCRTILAVEESGVNGRALIKSKLNRPVGRFGEKIW